MTFAEQVYALLRQVPKGRVTTYKVLAEKLGTKSYRAVGQALRKNPYAPVVPCHRVVSTGGSIGGFMGETSGVAITKKVQLLTNEGIKILDGNVENFEKVFFDYSESNS